MLQRKNISYLWLHIRTKRIFCSFIKNRASSVLILLCFCSLITSLVRKRNRDRFNDLTYACNKSVVDAWIEISVQGQVRTAKVLSGTNQFLSKNKSKIILLWTKYFSEKYSNDFYFFQRGQETFKKYNCKFSDCLVTRNRSLLPTADAVLFHAKDMRFEDMPERTSKKQIWILYSMEPPKYMVLKWKMVQSLFNWTMTYRADSDVQVKYGEVIPRSNSCTPFGSRHKSVSKRTRGALWLVSNCRTESRREAYVRELKNFFDIDIYGKCSRLKKCEPAQSEDCYKLLSNYKYYLSFENSLCKDYITEKFFNVLKYDVIPVVFGGGDYASVAPQNSFIDATSFPNPEKLAEHLLSVASNSTLYDSFFEWKKYYNVHLHPWMCDLCERLHKSVVQINTLPQDLWSWWVPGAFCRKWTKKRNFISIF